MGAADIGNQLVDHDDDRNPAEKPNAPDKKLLIWLRQISALNNRLDP